MQELEKPFFSVVVPTYERPDDLKRCLQSLDPNFQFATKAYEIIVSDDSNSNKCKILVEKDFPHVHWGKGKQNGPAGNRNAGVERANGEWIVFLDDDCIAQSGYLLAYANAIDNNPEILVFEGRIFADRPRKTWAEGCPENEHGGMLWTSNLCIHKSLFDILGGLDENFKVAFEDVDLAFRINTSERKSVFVYNASVCHPWRSLNIGGKNWKRKGYELESIKIFTAKHGVTDVTNWKLYLRHLFRMLTTDQIKSIIEFKGRGYLVHLNNIYINVLSICFLLKVQWQKKLLRK